MTEQANHVAAEGSRGVVVGNRNVQLNVTASRPPLDAATLAGMRSQKVAERITTMPRDDALNLLAAAPVETSAGVLRVLLSHNEELAISLLAEMNPARVQQMLDLIASALAGLEHLPAAADAISRCQDEWSRTFGIAGGALLRAGPSYQGTIGFCRRFTDGAIHWSPRGGAQPTTHAIAANHAKLGGSTGRLGFPLSPPEDLPRIGLSAGVRQRFESNVDYGEETCNRLGVRCGATVYWTAERGAFATWGGIGEHYEDCGGGDGVLGFPTGEEIETGPSHRDTGDGDHGWMQTFENGVVYFTGALGAVGLLPQIHAYHDRCGGTAGRLGFPRGPLLHAAPSPQSTSGDFQRFEGAWNYPTDLLESCIGFTCPGSATVYTSQRYGTYAVQAGIGICYERLGGTASWLGFPVSDEKDVDDRRRIQWFEGGAIYWSPEYDAVTVRQQFLDRVVAVADIGFPVSEERPIGPTRDVIQIFEQGLVTLIDGGLEVWHRALIAD